MSILVAAMVVTNLCVGEGADATSIRGSSIQQSVERVAQAGGGRVVIPAGIWETGPIHLRSNVELHLEEGAELRFSGNPADYRPLVRTAFSAIECYGLSPLIYAIDCTNVAVTGRGTLRPRMETWEKWFDRNTPAMFAAMGQLYAWGENDEPVENRRIADLPGATFRPALVEFIGCRGVRLEDFIVRGSPCWTIHLRLCEDALVRNLDVVARGFNNDGIDIVSSRRVLVEGCSFDQGDDAIVIKSGRDRDGRRVGVPCEDVEVRDCTIRRGHTLIAIGSEVSGGIRNIRLHDCRAEGDGVRVLLMVKTSDRKGAFIENIVVSNVTATSIQRSLLDINTDCDYQWKKYPPRERLITRIENVRLENVTCGSVDRIYTLSGDARLPVKGVTIRNVHVDHVRREIGTCTNIENFVVSGPVVRSKSLSAEFGPRGEIVHLVNSDGFDFIERTTPLWSVVLTRADCFTNRVTITSEDERLVVEGLRWRKKVEGDSGEIPLSTSTSSLHLESPLEEVVVTVTGDDRLRWRISVKTREGWVLETAQCPQMILKSVWDGATRDERITTGNSNGGCYRPLDPRRRKGFPTSDRPGRLSMQYAGMFNPVRGIYTAAEDPENESKTVDIIPTADLKGINWNWTWRCWQPGGGAQPYDVVMKGVSGVSTDWRDIADVYREWVMTQGWCAEPIPQRKDLPEWMKSGPAKTFFKRCWIADPDEIRRWMNEYYSPTFGATPLVVSFWGWEHQDLWVGPDYFPAFPSDEAFSALTRDLKAKGGHTFLWPSGFRWLTTFDRKGDGTFDFDDRADWDRAAKPHAVINRDGSEKTATSAMWWRGGSNKQVCGADPWSVNWFVENAKKMIALGAESIQVDQQGGGFLAPCYATNHGHTPGEGVWKVRAFTKFLETLRDELKKVSPDLVLGMEAPGDCYNRFWGIQDHRDCEPMHGAEWASTFNWLYHEYVPTFQSNMFMRRHDRPFVAHCAVDGQLPYAVPSRADYAKGESVIWNGGFEKTAPNGEFVGWERLRGEYRQEEQTSDDYYSMARTWYGRAYADRADVKEGAVSMRLETLNSEDTVGVSQDIFTDDEAFQPGARYRLCAWLKTDYADEPERCFMEPQVFTEGEMPDKTMPRVAFPPAGAGWRRVTVEFTLPEKAILLRPHFRTAGRARTRVDGVVLEKMGEEVVFTGRSKYKDFIKKWISLYHGEGRRYLAHGRQIRGAKVICGTFHYTAECHVNLIYNGHPNSGATDDEAMPLVASQSYEAADGSKALFLANVTDKPQKVRYSWLGKDHELTIAGDDLVMVGLERVKGCKGERVKGGCGKHDYFTEEALATADMNGLAEETAAALARCKDEFAAAEKLVERLSGWEQDAVRCRLTMARRLQAYVAKRAGAVERDEQILAWQGAQELNAFFGYFRREGERMKGERVKGEVFSVRDFGAKGDGVSDDGPAFRAALEKIRELKGAPCVLRVPAGVYRLQPDPRCPIKGFRCRDWQTGDNRGEIEMWKGETMDAHLFITDLDNLTIRGEGEKTVLLFTDAARGGVRVCGCYGTSVEDLALDYAENPSTQGTIVKVEDEPFALVLKRDAGYPDPDSPRFLKAPSRYFSPVGENMMYLPGGVARMGTVERVKGCKGERVKGDGGGEDLFRLRPFAHHLKDSVWRARRAGDRICIMARYAESQGGGPLRFLLSAFCGARGVRAFDSNGQVYSQSQSYATYIVNCSAVGREGSDDIVSSNADGFIGGGMIGPYVAGCSFCGLEDDGINVGSNTGELPNIPKDGYLRVPRADGGGQPMVGGLLADGVNGRVKMFVRYGADGKATRPLPTNAVPASVTKKLSAADRRKFGYNEQQKKGVLRADRLVRIPGTVGAVLKDTSFSRLRGRGIQVHSGNMLVENVKVSDVTGVGISVNALLPWGMCYDIHNVLVKDCSFVRTGSTGANLRPNPLVKGEPLRQRMHFGIAFENCVFEPTAGQFGAWVENDDDVLFSGCTFRTTGVKTPVKVVNATSVRVE